MAQIEKRSNGTYRIRVFCGYSADGTKQKSQSITWKPPKPNMTEKQIEKAVNKAAFEFEEKARSGQTVNAEKFEKFCETWFEVYAERTMKPSGVERCRAYTPRTYEKLGHLRIDKITPREIDSFIVWLGKQQVIREANAIFKGDLKAVLANAEWTQKHFAQLAGVSQQTVKSAIDGKPILWANAEKFSKVLGEPCSKLFEKKSEGKLLSPKTIKNYVSFVSSVFDYAVHIKAIKENPCKNAVIPKIPQKEHNMFTLEQAKQFLDILDRSDTPIKYKAFFQLALFGGFRRGEILGLEWNDIDFETGVVHVRRTVHYSKALGYYDTEPKSKSSVRALTLPQNVIFTIKQLQNEQNSQRLKLGDKWNDTRRLFTTWDGRQMHGATPFTWLTKICKEYNLPKVNLHSFRHLNASLLISSGVDVKTVQSVLGHSQASTTLDIYATAFKDREAQALGAVADILTSPTQKAAK
jgi:integrase